MGVVSAPCMFSPATDSSTELFPFCHAAVPCSRVVPRASTAAVTSTVRSRPSDSRGTTLMTAKKAPVP